MGGRSEVAAVATRAEVAAAETVAQQVTAVEETAAEVAEVAAEAAVVEEAVAVARPAVAALSTASKWRTRAVDPRQRQQPVSKSRRSALAMRRSMVKGNLGAPSLMHAQQVFSRKRVTGLPVMLEHRAPAPALPPPSHGLQMASVQAEQDESLQAHMLEEALAIEQGLKDIVDPVVKADSEVRSPSV